MCKNKGAIMKTEEIILDWDPGLCEGALNISLMDSLCDYTSCVKPSTQFQLCLFQTCDPYKEAKRDKRRRTRTDGQTL